jgi:hypothetical protein
VRRRFALGYAASAFGALTGMHPTGTVIAAQMKPLSRFARL